MNATAIATSSLLLIAASLTAQSNPEPPLKIQTRLVEVPTLVQTPSSDLIYTLSAQDFLVTDDGVPQAVTLDSTSAHPLSLIILMQTGSSAPKEFAKYRQLSTMLETLVGSAPNQVAVLSFDSKPEGIMPFTSDISDWVDAINQPDPGDHGAAILDSLAYALTLFKDQPAANRRAIILLSGPRDEGSKTTPKEIVRAAGETNTAIYALTFSPEKTAFKDAFTEPPHLNPPIPGYGQNYFSLSEPLGMIIGAMRKNTTAELATLTGGEAESFTNKNELDQALNTLTNHLHNGYLLSFTPTSNRAGLHTLQVRIRNHPELVISARTHYWATPPPQ